MAFNTGYLGDPNAVGSGEKYGVVHTILSSQVFEDGLKIGRFAKLDSGSIDNFDGSAAPVVAGIVRRNVANALEDDGTIDSSLYTNVEYGRFGLFSVEVKTGETPALFGRVHVSNAGDANDGKATANAADVAIDAEFICEIKTDVWLVSLALGASDASEPEEEIVDPGDGGAIPAGSSGVIAITTTGVDDTRTLAIPEAVGLELTISLDVDAGDLVLTVASAANQAGNNTLTAADAGDVVVLKSIQVAGAPVWRIVANDGVALSTV